jgi:antitoxin StbD
MQPIFAPFSASISELRKNPKALLEKSHNDAVAIFEHNVPAAYLISPVHYEQLLNRLEDYELGEIVKGRQAEKPFAVEVSLNDL